MRDFRKALRQFQNDLDEAQRHFRALGLADALDTLKPEAGHAEFRVSVLGRFKCGKSSTLNTLLGQPVLPVDTLPCTSAVVELRHGPQWRFSRSGSKGDATREDFERSAGSAASASATPETWEIQVPVEWLPPGLVFVDTPGTNEDEVRTKLARGELGRADAAIVLTSATQPVALEDLDLIDDLQRHVSAVLVLVTRADLLREEERERVLKHSQERVRALGVPPERVMLFSAAPAPEARGWAEMQLGALREALSEVLFANPSGERLRALCKRTEKRLKELENEVEDKVDAAKQQVSAAKSRVKAATRAVEACKSHSDDFREILEKHRADARKEARERTSRRWGHIVSSLSDAEDHWSSDRDPLFSPRAFAEEIGECAKESLQSAVVDFIREEIQPLMTDAVNAAREDIHGSLRDVAIVAAGDSDDSTDDLFETLDRAVLQDSFGDAVESTADTSTEAVVTTVVSAIVGYVVADVVLFYILGVIAGFLNPVLLAGAAVAGAGAYIFKGREWVQDYVRGKISETLQEKLKSKDVRQKVVDGVGQAVDEVFGKLKRGYEKQLKRLLKQAAATCEEEKEAAARALDGAARLFKAAEAAQAALQETIENLRRSSEEINKRRKELAASKEPAA